VLQRAHGVAPNADGTKAELDYQMSQPRRQQRSAPAKKEVPAPAAARTETVLPHLRVLADLNEQKKLIDTAIAAIEALYK
jgi:hypothetical protein